MQGCCCEAQPRWCSAEAGLCVSQLQLATYSLADDAPHGARERRRHAEAAVVQDVHGHLEAAAQLAQQTVGRHTHVVKVDLGRVGRLDSHLLLWRAAGRERRKRRHGAEF